MKNFIILSTTGNTKILVPVDNIAVIERNNNDNYNYSYLDMKSKQRFCVKESINEIYDMINS